MSGIEALNLGKFGNYSSTTPPNITIVASILFLSIVFLKGRQVVGRVVKRKTPACPLKVIHNKKGDSLGHPRTIPLKMSTKKGKGTPTT